MTTVRAVFHDVVNAIDFLADAGLTLSTNRVSMKGNVVAWEKPPNPGPFLTSREHATIDQYQSWIENQEYSAVLIDGSILQVTYEVEGGYIVAHRLAYCPCPFNLDAGLLAEEAILDVVSMYQSSEAILRTPLRFDYDLKNARLGHPATHLTLNSSDCRIACVAPLHILRFLDFVYRNFYSRLWSAHREFFEVSKWSHLDVTASVEQHHDLHVSWNRYMKASS